METSTFFIDKKQYRLTLFRRSSKWTTYAEQFVSYSFENLEPQYQEIRVFQECREKAF